MKNTLREAVWGPSLLLLALGAVTFGGCRAKTSLPGAGNPSTNPIIDAPAAKPVPATTPLEVVAGTNKSKVKAGDTIELQIGIKNRAQTPATLQFSSGQNFDFQAFKPGETDAAWTWSMDKNFLQALRSQTLAPGAELKFRAQWPDAPKGRYNVIGLITANGGLRAAPFEVVVE